MARQGHVHAVSSAVLVVLALTWSVHAEDRQISDKDLTCKTHGGALVLNDTDFASLSEETQGKFRISKQQFVSLKPDSTDRRRVCETRMLLRLVRSKRVTLDDFVDNYKFWLPNLLTKAERKEVLDAQIDTAAKNWR